MKLPDPAEIGDGEELGVVLETGVLSQSTNVTDAIIQVNYGCLI